MKKIISSFIVTVLITGLFGPAGIYAQEKKITVAVMDFNPLGVSASEAIFVTEFFRSALVTSDAFMVIDKANMDKLLAEQGFQQTGCTSQECAVKIGKLLNVQKMVNGNFGKLGETYQLTVNLVDIETGQIAYSEGQEKGYLDFYKQNKSTINYMQYKGK